MTLVVLALDALDAGLVEHFNLNSLRLSTSGELETFSHSMDYPYTPEVWSTIATGLSPNEHGVTKSGTSDWNQPLLNLASKFTGGLPLSVRTRLGEVVMMLTGAEYAVGETTAESFLKGDGRVVHNWPGVHNGDELATVWRLMSREENMTVGEFNRAVFAIGAEQFAWVEETLRHESSLIATHIHTLDALGHAYASNEVQLRRAYEWVANWVNRIRESMDEDDELVILSDHGMVVSFYSDDGDGDFPTAQHSWRAFVSSTLENVPDNVYDVYRWVEANVPEYDPDSEQLNLPEDQLRQLGYIE